MSVLLAGACQAEPEPMVSAGIAPDGGFPVRVDAAAGDASPGPIDAALPDASTLHFIDVGDHLQAPHDIDTWYGILAALRRDFDEVCGDTFCEGDFTNYQSLRFRCSVETSSEIVGSCSWVLAASDEEIVAGTGAIEVSGKIFRCEMPVRPDTSIDALMAALTAPDVGAIHAPLPGTDRSLFDGLADCL